MKKALYILTMFAALSVGLHAQSTNAAPVVTEPVASTNTVYSPGVIIAPPAVTATLQSSYLTPMLSATGLTVPTGAAVRQLTVVFYSDGSSKATIIPCAPSKLPNPPVSPPQQ